MSANTSRRSSSKYAYIYLSVGPTPSHRRRRDKVWNVQFGRRNCGCLSFSPKTNLDVAPYCDFSRKDLSLKHCKVDILLITGMLSPYATVVEKLFRDLDKDKVTMLKIERAGDVLADTVSGRI